jgi:RNA polymerase sigma factor (sigma-70 family)
MGNEAVRTLEEAEKLLSGPGITDTLPQGPLKLRLEHVSRRLLRHFKETAECRFFNAFYNLTNHLFTAYAWRRLEKFGCPIDPEDVANRMYILLFEKLLAPDDKVPMDYLFPWCYRVILNVAREEVRDWIKTRPMDTGALDQLVSPSLLDQLVEEEQASLDRSRFERVLELLYSEESGLSGRDRHVMRCFYLEGRSMREISADTGLTKSHIGVILMRGRRRIARRLKLEGPQVPADRGVHYSGPDDAPEGHGV